jgi:diketogulonate reductase-like aldo/keto reductase
MVNQIKFFIGYTQEQITLFCKDHNIVVEAYSPLATGSILGNEIIRSIATKYDKTVAQLCIRYIQQRGAVPIPKSVHPNYILQNGDLNFEISDQDMIFLDSLQDTVKLVQGSKKNLQFLNSLKRNTMTIIGPGNYITLKNIVRSILRLKQIIK